MNEAREEHTPFTLSTACKFCVKFSWYAQKTERNKPSGWYLTELNEDHSPECDRPGRVRHLNFKVIAAADIPALKTYSLLRAGKPWVQPANCRKSLRGVLQVRGSTSKSTCSSSSATWCGPSIALHGLQGSRTQRSHVPKANHRWRVQARH